MQMRKCGQREGWFIRSASVMTRFLKQMQRESMRKSLEVGTRCWFVTMFTSVWNIEIEMFYGRRSWAFGPESEMFELTSRISLITFTRYSISLSLNLISCSPVICWSQYYIKLLTLTISIIASCSKFYAFGASSIFSWSLKSTPSLEKFG